MNDLLSRLQRALARQRGLVADASHELRTPFAVLRGELELAGRPGRSREELVEAVARASEEVARLARITEQLLFLARSDEDGVAPQLERTNMRQLLTSSAEQAAARATTARVSCEVDGARLTANVDPDRIREAVDNMVDNALRFAPAGTAIQISASALAVISSLRCAMRGPASRADFLPHAFERFRAQTPGVPALGGGRRLGLAIVSAVAQAHGGRATARTSPKAALPLPWSFPVHRTLSRPADSPDSRLLTPWTLLTRRPPMPRSAPGHSTR